MPPAVLEYEASLPSLDGCCREERNAPIWRGRSDSRDPGAETLVFRGDGPVGSGGSHPYRARQLKNGKQSMTEAARRPLILVVDDVEEDRVYLCTIVESAGYEVRCANDAEAGLKEARRGQPSLVIMDVQMPGLSGLEATRRLKSDPLTARMPVIIVTGYDMNRKEAREARYDGFLKKPVVHEELTTLIERLLSPPSAG